MNKQIEEMAKIVRIAMNGCNGCGCHWADGDCVRPPDIPCSLNDKIIKSVQNLYDNGYRKASDVARAIFAEIDKTAYGDMDFFKMLKKKYESEGADDEQAD